MLLQPLHWNIGCDPVGTDQCSSAIGAHAMDREFDEARQHRKSCIQIEWGDLGANVKILTASS
jgi:hypothetical protein